MTRKAVISPDWTPSQRAAYFERTLLHLWIAYERHEDYLRDTGQEKDELLSEIGCAIAVADEYAKTLRARVTKRGKA